MSGGYILDLAYLNMAIAIIQVAQNDLSESEGVVPITEGISYHDNKKIDRRLNALLEEGRKIVRNQSIENLRRLRTKSNLVWQDMLELTKGELINLENLSLFILFCRFCERDKPLHSDFEPFTKAERYFGITDILNKNGSFKEDVMFNIANEIANRR